MPEKSSPIRARSESRLPSADGHPVENELLLRLPTKESDAIFPTLIYLKLRSREVLHEPGQTLKFAYFMNFGLTSILNVLGDGKSVEVGLTGKEGFVGMPLVVNFSSSPTRAVVQIEGAAFRVKAEDLADLIPQCPEFSQRLQRYVQRLAMQATHVAACNRIHEVEERLARWLLMCQDRVGSDTVPLTQEILAHMLGTRRASVTVAAGILQKAGLINYSRGTVNIVNRQKLQDASCECYAAMMLQSAKWDKESR
jgi:CRP-like cAMP-binding protein